MPEVALQVVSSKPRRGTRPMVQKAVRDAIAIQQVLVRDIANKSTTPVARAALARAWSTVQESIRIMRGIPLPGQFRPDGDPVKGAKKLRGKVLEIDAGEHPDDDAPADKVKRGPFGRPLTKAPAAEPTADQAAEPPAADSPGNLDAGSSPTAETPE